MKTLIIEDSSTLCAIYQAYLEGTGLDIHTVETYADALQALDTLAPELILLDIELPDGNGLDLLAETSLMSSPPAVVVMTGHGAQYSEQAMQRGADDFLNKPFDASRLRVTLNNAAAKMQLSQQLRDLSTSRERLGSIIGGSAAMQAVYDAIDSLSGSRATAFITGESGTGKELAPEPFTICPRERNMSLLFSIARRFLKALLKVSYSVSLRACVVVSKRRSGF